MGDGDSEAPPLWLDKLIPDHICSCVKRSLASDADALQSSPERSCASIKHQKKQFYSSTLPTQRTATTFYQEKTSKHLPLNIASPDSHGGARRKLPTERERNGVREGRRAEAETDFQNFRGTAKVMKMRHALTRGSQRRNRSTSA